MRPYTPPFQITPAILQSVAEICEMLGRWSVSAGAALSPQLRRDNRIRTIHASLAIENNTLSLEQVTAVLAGKRVLGLPREVQEVRNAFAAYEGMKDWTPSSADDLLAAHGVLMAGLVDAPGCFRSGGVGIYRGKKLVHMAPPAKRVPVLMRNLVEWLASTDTHPLIAGSVFHYELEFIHPFSDGNGRMGRLWQTLILSRWQPMLAYLPVESVIRKRQSAYYQALADADAAADATVFVEFMLNSLSEAMNQVLTTQDSDEILKTSGKVSGKTSGKILAQIRANPLITIPELAAIIGVTGRSIERNIQKLQQAGALKRIGPAKGGRWEIIDD